MDHTDRHQMKQTKIQSLKSVPIRGIRNMNFALVFGSASS